MHLHASDQFADKERLNDVVVRAQLQAEDASPRAPEAEHEAPEEGVCPPHVAVRPRDRGRAHSDEDLVLLTKRIEVALLELSPNDFLRSVPALTDEEVGAYLQENIEPLRAKLRWGFNLSYMITGMLNEHPRAAMAFNAEEKPGDLVKFFDSLIDAE